MKQYELMKERLFSKEFEDFCTRKISPVTSFYEKIRKLFIVLYFIIPILIVLSLFYIFSEYGKSGSDLLYIFFIEMFFIALIIIPIVYKFFVSKTVFHKLIQFFDDFTEIKELEAPLNVSFMESPIIGYIIKGEYKSITAEIVNMYFSHPYKHRYESDKTKEGLLCRFKNLYEYPTAFILPSKYLSQIKVDTRYLKSTSVNSYYAFYTEWSEYIEKLISFSQKYNNLIFSSCENGYINIFINIKNKSFFELPFWTNPDRIQNYRDILSDVIDILEIADYFIPDAAEKTV